MLTKIRISMKTHNSLPLRTRLQVGIFYDSDAYINAFNAQSGCKKNISPDCNTKRWDFYYKNVADCNKNKDCIAACDKGLGAIYDYWNTGTYYPNLD